MTAAIHLENLTRRFGKRAAVDHLSFDVQQGEIFGFLGPNGAGKSTTIRMLLDLTRPTSGHASILGFDCQSQALEVRKRVGYLPGDLRLYPRLTGAEHAALVQRVRGGGAESKSLPAEVAARLDLDLHRPAGECSKGTRQKIGILLALLGDPEVLLLDEPTSGLDPLMQRATWELLRERAANGTTVFFSSHVLGEVEEVCERVGILRTGRLVALEPLTQLQGAGIRRVEVRFASPPSLNAFDLPGITVVQHGAEIWKFDITGDLDSFIKALARFEVRDMKTMQPTLDDVLFSYYQDGAS